MTSYLKVKKFPLDNYLKFMDLKKMLSLWLNFYYNNIVIKKKQSKRERERQERFREIPYESMSSPQETPFFSVSQSSQGTSPTLCMQSFVSESIVFTTDCISGSILELAPSSLSFPRN